MKKEDYNKLKKLIKEQLLYCCLEPNDGDKLEITAEVSLDIILEELKKLIKN